MFTNIFLSVNWGVIKFAAEGSWQVPAVSGEACSISLSFVAVTVNFSFVPVFASDCWLVVSLFWLLFCYVLWANYSTPLGLIYWIDSSFVFYFYMIDVGILFSLGVLWYFSCILYLSVVGSLTFHCFA